MPKESSKPFSLLFKLEDTAPETIPQAVTPSTYKELKISEPAQLEKWLENLPDILGEELLVITTQFGSFDKTNRRLDILALDRAGKLVVVELKLDSSGRDQDLQAIHYAAFVSSFSLEAVAEEYAKHHSDKGKKLSTDEALKVLEAFTIEGSLEGFDDDNKPRIILVAKSFAVEVTTGALWLIEVGDLDITCIELVPYEMDGNLLLTSAKRVPLPEAADFRMQRKRKRKQAQAEQKVEWEKAMQVMASIPAGHWMSYQDLAVAAGGSPRAGMAVGQYLANTPDLPPDCVHRVLRSNGTISPHWQGEIGGPSEARELLESEGLSFTNDKADPAKRWTPAKPG